MVVKVTGIVCLQLMVGLTEMRVKIDGDELRNIKFGRGIEDIKCLEENEG